MAHQRSARAAATRLAVLIAMVLTGLVTIAPPAHASFPSTVMATAVASHPNGWVAVQEVALSDDSGDHDFLVLRGVSPTATWGWRVDLPACWCTRARNPDIAFNGTNFLVVWEDDRTGSWDIYGAVVSPTGSVVKQPFKVSGAAGDQLSPSVAGLGSQFLVVWQDHRVGVNADIYSSRVSGAGAVTSPAGVRVSGASNLQANPSVAANGQQWLVVWNDKRNAAATGVDVYSTRISTTGAVTSPSGVEVSRAARDQFKPVVAWNGTNYVVAWTDSRNSTVNWDVFGSRISTAGATLDPSGITITNAAGKQSQPTISRSSSRVLVAWTNPHSYGTSIRGRFVTATGTVSSLVSITTACTEPAPGCDPSLPAAAAVGGTVLVVFRVDDTGFQDSLFGQRVGSGGALVGPPSREYPY